MVAFRAFLVAIFVVIAGYTLVVASNHGKQIHPVFFGDMAAMEWPGQFNVDFMCMLLLSGLWVSWRHQFSAAGLVLGLIAVFGGALFLRAYLLVASIRSKGDIRALLLGETRGLR
jgi:NADH:ubiquinone oxidoreductase subunit 2 (subunit N)